VCRRLEGNRNKGPAFSWGVQLFKRENNGRDKKGPLNEAGGQSPDNLLLAINGELLLPSNTEQGRKKSKNVPDCFVRRQIGFSLRIGI